LARIRTARSVPKHDDFGVQSVGGQLEQAHSAKAQVFMLGIGRTATVEHHDTLPICQDFLMGIPCNHDIHGGRKELL
jgi:hypothetical protein